MTDVWDRDASNAGDQPSTAFREAQLRSSNVYGFRRLKWGLPKLPRSRRAGVRPQFTLADLLLVVVIFGAFGLVAALAWPN